MLKLGSSILTLWIWHKHVYMSSSYALPLQSRFRSKMAAAWIESNVSCRHHFHCFLYTAYFIHESMSNMILNHFLQEIYQPCFLFFFEDNVSLMPISTKAEWITPINNFDNLHNILNPFLPHLKTILIWLHWINNWQLLTVGSITMFLQKSSFIIHQALLNLN